MVLIWSFAIRIGKALTFCKISSSSTSFIKSLEIVPFISQGDFWQLCYCFLNTGILGPISICSGTVQCDDGAEQMVVMSSSQSSWLYQHPMAMWLQPGCLATCLYLWPVAKHLHHLMIVIYNFPCQGKEKSGRKLAGMVTSLPIGAPSPSPSVVAPTSHAPLHIFPKPHCTSCNIPDLSGISCPVVKWELICTLMEFSGFLLLLHNNVTPPLNHFIEKVFFFKKNLSRYQGANV